MASMASWAQEVTEGSRGLETGDTKKYVVFFAALKRLMSQGVNAPILGGGVLWFLFKLVYGFQAKHKVQNGLDI